jgi:protein subunit release factor A
MDRKNLQKGMIIDTKIADAERELVQLNMLLEKLSKTRLVKLAIKLEEQNYFDIENLFGSLQDEDLLNLIEVKIRKIKEKLFKLEIEFSSL